MTIDLGTGDGRLPWTLARRTPERLFVGIDANAAGLRELSQRALRVPLPNLLYVRAAVESLPAELQGTADRLTVVLPWGSLLAAVARPNVPVLRGIRALCQPGARLTVVLGSDPDRDRAELSRLAIDTLDADALAPRLATGYGEAGLALARVESLDRRGLAGWPSTWTTRLARGEGRRFVAVQAIASPAG